ncbi:iron-containing alcohol dehydrogenase [Chloroflexota bacterium]
MVTERESALIFRLASPKMVYSRNALSLLWEELESLKTHRAMIVCGPNILRKSNVITRVQEALREKYIGLFSEVEEHSPVEIIDRGAEVARELDPDVFISVGGGSTHDTTKGIATVLAEGKEMRECLVKIDEASGEFIQPSLNKPKIPIIAIPTTLGCAEYTGRGAFFDKKLNARLHKTRDEKVVPKVIIVDGLALATTPTSIHLRNGMSEIRVCVDRICVKRPNPVADALALHGIKLLSELLPQCAGRDADVLLQTKKAAALVYFGPHPGSGLTGLLGHEITAVSNVTHAIAMAIMVPHVMRFNVDTIADREALIAQALGIDTSGLSNMEAGLAAAEAIVDMSKKLGLPTRLRDVGVPQTDLELIVRATIHELGTLSNPKTTDPAQVLDLLEKAW